MAGDFVMVGDVVKYVSACNYYCFINLIVIDTNNID